MHEIHVSVPNKIKIEECFECIVPKYCLSLVIVDIVHIENALSYLWSRKKIIINLQNTYDIYIYIYT